MDLGFNPDVYFQPFTIEVPTTDITDSIADCAEDKLLDPAIDKFYGLEAGARGSYIVATNGRSYLGLYPGKTMGLLLKQIQTTAEVRKDPRGTHVSIDIYTSLPDREEIKPEKILADWPDALCGSSGGGS